MTDIANNGWTRDLEDLSFLKECTRARVPGDFKTFGNPPEVRPDKEPNSHQLENQANMGSCQGHAIASCVEQLNTISTGGDRTQLSNIFAYIGSQKITGSQLFGRDSGSTISSGVKLATGSGICPESLAPYPNPVRYPNQRDRNAILKQSNYEAGEPYRIRSEVGIKSYEQAVDWIGGGGVISLGMSWSPPMKTINGRKTMTAIARRGGGHAVAPMGYKKNGNIIVANSHNYWFDIPPDVFAALLRHSYTVAVGLSDMLNPVPRDLSFLKKRLREKLGKRKELWK